MLRKILLALLIVFCIAFGVGLYIFFFRPELLSTIIPAQTTGNNQSPWFFPFNRLTPGVDAPAPIATTTRQEPNQQIPQQVKRPRLFQVYDKPVSGFYASSTSATSSTVRFVDRGNGHIYETNLQTGAVVKISNTTLPKVYTTIFSPSGNNAVLGFLRDNDTNPTHTILNIQTIKPITSRANPSVVPVRTTATTTATSTPGLGLPRTAETTYTVKPTISSRDILSYITAPQSERFVAVRTINSGITLSLGSLSNPLISQQIFQSPLPLWNIDWPTEEFLVLTTKASGRSGGYAYTLNTRTRVFDKVISNVLGLTTKMSKDGAKILFSESRGRIVQTKVYSLKDGNVLDTVLGTVADKCAWSRVRLYEVICAVPSTPLGNLMPDDWYKGTVSFDDKLWYLNTQTGETVLLSDLYDEAKQEIDVLDPVFDPRENYLVFMNKQDLTLWALDLND